MRSAVNAESFSYRRRRSGHYWNKPTYRQKEYSQKETYQNSRADRAVLMGIEVSLRVLGRLR
jgi:hypothetical protein